MIYINLILVFLVLVAIHEYGHYIVARLFKAEVTDFSIGFGKPLLKYTDRNGTTWKLSPIPLGGYVKIKGLDNIFSPNPNDEQGSFQSLTLFQKILVLLAGSIFNILSAWFALFCIFFFFGIVSLMPIIGSVSENSSAFENDLREGDRILEINNISIEEFSDIPKAIANNQSINILIERNNQIIEKNFDLKFNEELNRYIIGISSPQNPIIDKYNLIDSIKNSSLFIPTYYAASFTFLQQSYKENTLGDQLAGPIGIVKNADQMMLDQVRGVLFLFIIISLFVGLFNLLPIPLLDGSAIQWVRDFEEAGIKKAPRPDNFFREINKSIILNKEDSVIAATPSEKTTIISTISFSYKAIGNQTFVIDLNPKSFVEMIAPARTFGFKDQFQELSELGLIKGGSLENALVCDGDKWVNPPLRFDNEPIRHKILDLIGDLALVGLPKAQILVYKGSHSLNSLLASSLKN